MNHPDKEWELFFPKDTSVVVGVSGGADSVCLLHLLKTFAQKQNLTLLACHINHNLRGEESLRDVKFVEALCHDWGIKLFVHDVDVKVLAQESKISVEECGRMIRYEFFQKIAAQHNAKIATAHTFSDTVETVLFNLIRGCGLKGICGIPKIRGDIIRPILSLTRTEVEAYCTKHNLSFVVDSSNAQTIYTRNKLRHEVIPLLKEINPQMEQTLKNSLKTFIDEESFLNETARTYFNELYVEGKLLISGLKKQHIAIQKRLLILFLQEHKLEVNAKNITAILVCLDKKMGKINICKDGFIENNKGYLYFSHSFIPEEYFEFPLCEGEFVSKTGKIYKIQFLEINSLQKFNNSSKNVFNFFIDCGKMFGSTVIRQKKNADVIRLSYKVHSISLKKLFNASGVSPKQRKKLFVIADEKGVIAVEDFGIDQRVCCDESTVSCIHISMEK